MKIQSLNKTFSYNLLAVSLLMLLSPTIQTIDINSQTLQAEESFLSVNSSDKLGLDYYTQEPVSGTNGKLFTNTEYAIKSVQTGGLLDSKQYRGTYAFVWLLEKNFDPWRQWTIVDLKDGSYGIRSVYLKSYLDAGGDYSYVSKCDDYCSEWQRWRIDQVQGSFAIYSLKRQGYLDSNEDQRYVYINTASVSSWQPINNQHLLWEFIPVYDIDLNTKFTHFDFKMNFDELMNLQNKKILLAGKETIRNPSQAEITKRISFSQKQQNQLSFGFSESISITSSVEFGVKFGPANVKTTESVTGSFSANQQITTSTESTLEQSIDIKVPAQTSIQATYFIDRADDVKIPFSATMEITGKYHGKNQLVGYQQVWSKLQKQGFSQKITSMSGNTVYAYIEGNMTVSIALEGRIEIKDIQYEQLE